ncbi:SDR family NAD(P)-dependent oxidoreductase [Nocardiopsis deserti]|uniref:SDR family NAD(P)-dependent oxidoreductase n=1 Tax=Nocardiopsis deserti TaxID=2605988 RepID=UPI001CC24574|nr:SDR family NAD(P)-dependent oxidoreductase [Nocardiopsis deserti]
MESTSFGATSTAREVVAGHDLRGRDVVVTGGASGLGIETVRALAVAGARVVIAGRDRVAAEKVAAEVSAETGNGSIEFGELELSSLDSVRAFAAWYTGLGRPLHLLFNNAGVMLSDQAYTENGFEWQFGVNHMGHFVLTLDLLPALRAAGGARVIALSSAAHRHGGIDFEDPNFRRRPYDRLLAYAQAKSANALFAVGLHQRHADDGITANAVHPGIVLTGLQRHITREEKLQFGLIDQNGTPNPNFKSAEQGAATSLWAATAAELDGVGGRYLEDCGIGSPAREGAPGGYEPRILDPEQAERLWKLSTELAG